LAQTIVNQMKTVHQGVGWGAGVLAGAGAGIVAALACVVLVLVLREAPPPTYTAWSAFVAGVLGGVVYAWMSRVVSRPALALWIISLGLATVDSLMIIALPLPAGPAPKIGIPAAGLIVPIRQAAALVGMGQFSDRHFPAAFLVNVTIIHYVTAVAVALLVPWWARRRTP
jgi:hypothetical protein